MRNRQLRNIGFMGSTLATTEGKVKRMSSAPDKASLLMASELAHWLRVKRSWVYAHSDELGVYRLGKYLRFSLARVLEQLEAGPIKGFTVKLPTQRPIPNPTKKDTSGDYETNSEQI